MKLGLIGKGIYAKVYKAVEKSTGRVYAIKEIRKSLVLHKRSIKHMRREVEILSEIENEMIVNMRAVFQDMSNIYMVLDYMKGGDLAQHLHHVHKFSEEQTKFFVACIMMSLEYLHSNGIVHRDVKPTNLMFDDRHYLRLGDFGISEWASEITSANTSGTITHMAPEVICGQMHGITSDYYSLGVVCYQCMLGVLPYTGKDRKTIRENILANQVQIKKDEIPEEWSLEAADFVNRLLQRKPGNRLGLNGPIEVKNHVWLKTFPWEKLRNGELVPPYMPKNVIIGSHSGREVPSGKFLR